MTLRPSKVLARRWLSDEDYELEIERPAGFRFVAGQHIRVVTDAGERDYSLVNGPDDASLRLCIRRVAAGAVSNLLAEAPPGSPLVFRGPRGHFVGLSAGLTPVWVASGTGIAPFVSMARAGAAGYHLLHGVRAIERLHYAPVLAARAASYVACVSGDRAGSVPAGIEIFRGRVTGCLAARLPSGRYAFHLCGGSAMVHEATALIDSRFPGSLVFSEVFF